MSLRDSGFDGPKYYSQWPRRNQTGKRSQAPASAGGRRL